MMGDSQSSCTSATRLYDSSRGGAETLSTSERLRLRRRSEPENLCGIGPSATELLRLFDRVLTSGTSEAALIWPQQLDGVAIIHALSALQRLGSCDSTGFATLFFPWSRSTGGTQRTLLIDRSYIDEATLPTLNRVLLESSGSSVTGYLMALHSLKHLLTSGKKDMRFRKAIENDPGLVHPTLFEITPQNGIENAGVRTYEDQFLRRLQRHTWISERREHTDAAADPLRTPFFLFGVHANAARIKLLRAASLDPRHGGRRPDIILIDLTRRARNRLGKNWRQPLARFLSIVRDLYGTECPPVLAVTDDVFVLQALRWEIIKEFDIRRSTITHHKRPAKSHVVLNSKPDLLGQESASGTGLSQITAEVYGADVLEVVDSGLKLRRALLDAGEEEIADAVTTAVSVLQNIIGLPGSPRELNKFLTENYEGFELQSMGAKFDHIAPRSKIKPALKLGLAGANHKRLSQFLISYDKLCELADTNNPGHKLFDECVRGLTRKATRSIIVFSSELLRGFAEWRIEGDAALSDVRPSLGRKLLLVDRREAIEELDLSQQEQKLFQRIIFIEPYADDLLHVLTRPWLPESVYVLSNLARVEQTLRRIRILLEIDGIEPIGDMLLAVQTEFERAMDGRSMDIPDLDAEPQLPRLGTLDLTTVAAPGSGHPRIITTSGNLQIRAFDGSEVALYDPEALQVFTRKLAKDLQPGEQICVFSHDFVDMAREKLSLTADASNVLSLYHEAVVGAVENLPGADITAKVNALRESMLNIDPTLALPGLLAMRHWIDVADLIDAPRNEVRPQAPRNRHHYLSFMNALGISEDVARHYWDWGIFWTRSMRIRTGSAFHQVFMRILIDPYGTISQLPEKRRHEVWRIYETAEHHVVTVVSNEPEGSR